MKYEEFRNLYRDKGIVSSKDFPFLGNPDYLRRQISDWISNENLMVLKRGIYLINDPLMLERISVPYVANFIYQPSYLSLEWALRYHQLMPEEVYQYTSVSTKKTATFSNGLGEFSYRKVKNAMFWGYQTVKHRDWTVRTAYPEKALLDFFYLNKRVLRESSGYLETFRFQNLDSLNMKRLRRFFDRIMDSGVRAITQHFAELYNLKGISFD